MKEIKKEMRVFEIEAGCEVCKSGLMAATGGELILKGETLFTYKCNNCGSYEDSLEIYPCMRFEDAS